MATFDHQFEDIIKQVGSFTATHAPKLGRYYLYFNGDRVGQINSGKHPNEVYGSVDKWIEHVKKRSQQRLNKIYEIQSDLANESCDLDCLVREAEALTKTG